MNPESYNQIYVALRNGFSYIPSSSKTGFLPKSVAFKDYSTRTNKKLFFSLAHTHPSL